jgi:hypothetical protein
MFTKKALAASVSAPPAVYVEDVFSTYLYTGNGSTQTITNGIDLAGEGGLVWFKHRTVGYNHALFDTARGATKRLVSNSTGAEDTQSTSLTAFDSTGFTLGADSGGVGVNISSESHASWTFRKAAKFFDVVTYTGDGANRTVAHNLDSVPGCIIVKRTDTTSAWQVYHRANTAAPETDYLVLNTTAATADSDTRWNDTLPTSTVFSLGTEATVNASGGTYVAYLFAHDAGGFGDAGTDNVVSCGSYTGNGSTSGPTVTLGWEPQWVLVKRATGGTGSWFLVDNMREFTVSGSNGVLLTESSNQEFTGTYFAPIATGFKIVSDSPQVNSNSATYIYIAIRRGPMKTPTSGTEVFQAKVYTGTNVDNRLVTTDIVTDLAWVRQRDDTVLGGMAVGDRLRGQPYLLTGTTAAEVNDADSFDREIVSGTEYGTAFSSMTGFWVGNDATSKLNANTTSNNHVVHAFRRAPGFFDVVAYTGTGANRTVSHNLGVVPELIIVKRRNNANSWVVYSASLGATKYIRLNLSNSESADSSGVVWNTTAPSSSVFSVGTDDLVNGSADTYIAYLFATLPGVSKVGSYTGTGTTLDIDCGFTAGARFVLIKRTDSTGDWFVWDTARGIISGNDPYLLLNSTAAEVTNTDYIDPLSSGFQISSTAPAAINASGGSFIFLAIA